MHQSEYAEKRPAPSVHLDFPYYRGKHSEHPPGPGGSAGGGQSRRVRTLPGGGPGRHFWGGPKNPDFGPPPGGVTVGLRPPRPDPPGGGPPFGPPGTPREGGVRTPPPEGVRDPPPGVPG